MQLTGRSIIGYRRGSDAGVVLSGTNPSTGESLLPDFYSASEDEMHEALELATNSFARYCDVDAETRALFLRSIADNLFSFGDQLIERAVQETGLTATRIRSELDRTCFQLRFFADIVEEGSWLDARIDRADHTRRPTAKPDVRSMLRPLGPIVIFCASNFPLAFSVAGADTASTLAAGNTVVILAHYSHPGTAEYAGTAISDAAQKHGLPEGVFSLLYDAGHGVAQALVKHPCVKGVGFTGSRAGGTALMKEAGLRPDVIPFYAEMSSVNPVFVLPAAISNRSETIANELHNAVTLGVGQFCTNPGLVITMGDADQFVSQLTKLMDATPRGTMLNRDIATSYHRAVTERSALSTVRLKSSSLELAEDSQSHCAGAALVFETSADNLLADPSLQAEIFGPATLLVRAQSRQELLAIARALDGGLTATILGTEEDARELSDLISLLERKAGRLIFNALPTGVEVCQAMVHGGPFPATSDGRSTSVGGRAILRFTRQVCYQDFPDVLLPPALQDVNRLRILRMEDW